MRVKIGKEDNPRFRVHNLVWDYKKHKHVALCGTNRKGPVLSVYWSKVTCQKCIEKRGL